MDSTPNGKAEAGSLRGLGLFSLCLGIAALGIGGLAFAMIGFQRAMFAKIEEVDPNFSNGDADMMLGMFDRLHGLMAVHMPIFAVGGVALIVLGVMMRRGSRRAGVGVVIVSGLAVLELAYYSWASMSLMADSPMSSDADMPFDFDRMMTYSAIMNFVFVAAPPVLLGILTARALRRDDPQPLTDANAG